VNALINLELVKRFKYRSNVVESGCSGDGTSSRFDDKLKTNLLIARKVKEKRVADIKFRVNERSSNIFITVKTESVTNTSKITNDGEARLTDSRAMVR
jgi:hypothetical protein